MFCLHKRVGNTFCVKCFVTLHRYFEIRAETFLKATKEFFRWLFELRPQRVEFRSFTPNFPRESFPKGKKRNREKSLSMSNNKRFCGLCVMAFQWKISPSLKIASPHEWWLDANHFWPPKYFSLLAFLGKTLTNFCSYLRVKYFWGKIGSCFW